MSYEGHMQIWCTSCGTYWEEDCYLFDSHTPKCPSCGSNANFVNSVDDTNCEADGEIEDTSKIPLIYECKKCYNRLKQAKCYCGNEDIGLFMIYDYNAKGDEFYAQI